PRGGVRVVRPRAAGGRVDRPGVRGSDARGAGRRGQGPVSRGRRRDAGGSGQLSTAVSHGEPGLPPARPGPPRRRDPGAARRGAGLPFRAAEPGALPRALSRPSVHPRPRGRARAVHAARADDGTDRGLPWPEAQRAPDDIRTVWAEVIYRYVFGTFNREGLF